MLSLPAAEQRSRWFAKRGSNNHSQWCNQAAYSPIAAFAEFPVLCAWQQTMPRSFPGLAKLPGKTKAWSTGWKAWAWHNKLGVRSLANASRARQFNPLNPPGVGWVPLPQTNMAAVVARARSCVRGRSCVVVRGRSCAVVRGSACVVGHAWSCAVGRAWSCVVVRGRSCVVGRAWSCAVGRAVVPFCPLRGQHCRDTKERTNNI